MSTASESKRVMPGPVLTITATEARAILRVKFAKVDLARMDRLLARNAAGRMTEPERTEMLGLLQMGSLLSLLHTRARMTLKGKPAAPRRKSALTSACASGSAVALAAGVSIANCRFGSIRSGRPSTTSSPGSTPAAMTPEFGPLVRPL